MKDDDAPCGRYEIETKIAGVWDTQDHADNLEDALRLASAITRELPEDKIRISTPDYKII